MANRFLQAPSRGGWLTIVNCVFWAVAFLTAQYGTPTPSGLLQGVLIGIFIFFSAPFAIFFMMPQLDYAPTRFDIIKGAVVIGLNAIVWGYGLSILLGRRGRRERRRW